MKPKNLILAQAQAELENDLDRWGLTLTDKPTECLSKVLIITLYALEALNERIQVNNVRLAFLMRKVPHWLQGALDRHALLFGSSQTNESELIRISADLLFRRLEQEPNHDLSATLTLIRLLQSLQYTLEVHTEFDRPEINAARRALPMLITDLADLPQELS